MDELTSQIPTTNGQNGIGLRHSPTIGKLIEALAKAQLEFKPIVKATSNPYYNSKYADLADVISATQSALAKNGLVVTQWPSANLSDKTMKLTTVLAHSSGEWMASDMEVPGTMMGKDKVLRFDVQSLGSAETYTRRYAYQAIVGVAAEADDDGNAATDNGRRFAEQEDRMSEQARINPAQVSAIWEACKRSGKTPEQLSEYLKTLNGYIQLEEVQKQHFQDALKWANTKGNYSESALKTSVEQAQFKKLFALAKKHNVSDADMHQYIKETWGHASMKELTQDQFRQLGEWLESVPV